MQKWIGVDRVLNSKHLPARSRSRLPKNLFGEQVGKGKQNPKQAMNLIWFMVSTNVQNTNDLNKKVSNLKPKNSNIFG